MSDDFTKGFACAAALIMRTHHNDCVAREVILSHGIPAGSHGLRQYLFSSGVDIYDIQWLDKAFRECNEYQHALWYGMPTLRKGTDS